MSGGVLSTTDEDFAADVLTRGGLVLVDFWASWCAPCREVASVLDDVAALYPDRLTVVALNVEENPETTRAYHVRGLPTLLLFSDGTVVKKIVGGKSQAGLLRRLSPFLNPR